MKYKMIICDLDGTLLDSKHEIAEETYLQIKRVTEIGIKFILATGRHYVDVKGVAKELNLDTCVVGSNGTRVYNGKGELLFKHNLNADVVKEVLKFKFPDDVHLNIYQGKEWLVFKSNQELLDFHKHSGFKYRMLKSIDEVDVNDVSKFYIYSHNKTALQKLEKELQEYLNNKADVFFSLHSVVEIMPKNISKGLVLKELAKKLNIELNEVIAFGDGLNDKEMLEYAGKGLIMENADVNLIDKLPHLEIIKSNDNNGVAEYLSTLC
ncbi:MAG: HAD family hydrolase [Ichthyobacteriaceae bacterium]|nr:HAD family hydrolase [Ichthyobacteriaceae bacterium]